MKNPLLKIPQGIYYERDFLFSENKKKLLDYLLSLYPIWEQRYSASNPPPAGKTHRELLRPVYWLGNWQFACLDYYHPPKGILHRCIRAEPFPEVIEHLVRKMEQKARQIFSPRDIPAGWHLNTCLVNYYGKKQTGVDKWVDTARVGEHRDFEPGPVGSISLGERAFFQFVSSRGKGTESRMVFQQWLEDGSLQLFGGKKWKEDLFHRVQRVDKNQKVNYPLKVEGFQARRINLTFRYVPKVHIYSYSEINSRAAGDVLPYMEKLAEHSSFFEKEIRKR